MNISKEFKENIKSLGFAQMTTIQSLCINPILEKKDVIVQSKTGSGKTVAFSIPLVNKLEVKKYKIQALILAPTRELANQIAVEIRKLSRHIPNVKVLTLCGGTPYKPQVASLQRGAHIVVGTVGRVLQHINETKVDFSNINTLVLDEADKMLDMGFYDEILKIVEYLPKQRQSLLFSATYLKDIETLSKKILKEPLFIKNEETHEKESINQKLYEVESENKTSLLLSLIERYKMDSLLIFCNTKLNCDELADDLEYLGIDVLTLHSDFDQRQRDETVILFANGSYPVLITTDILSRGIDIKDIKYVVNYDIPRDETIYTHRIGRTARGESSGVAITFYEKEESYKVTAIKEKFPDIEFNDYEKIEEKSDFIIKPEYKTMMILAGKKQKLRAGDILGSLTAGIGLKKEDIGKINILDFFSYVAIKEEVFKEAFSKLQRTKIKGKFFKLYEK
ncbi:DEAD-box ATP-dependent RNA helicase [Halarcobacter anaerophilus]|nr:ATP-dependent RNA helicase DbpA [Halarcobacter anaerophilus]QDF28567.1 DEAD-box ATP-dependent RNA helicase [Halarcobacter anaerophilus]